MNGAFPPMALVAVLALSLGAVCCRLVLRGRAGVAWALAGGVLLGSAAVVAVLDALDSHGQAGLALLMMIVLFVLPLLAGAVLGCVVGHLARWLRPQGGGPAAT